MHQDISSASAVSLAPDGIVLAIETSCDETSAAVLRGAEVASNVISSQLEHSRYGGVVPELASRAHLSVISTVVREALSEAGIGIADVDAVAVTSHPGLVGSLIVGANFAKGLALRYSLPLVAVNHIEGHIYSAFLNAEQPEFPFLALVVSGGHTALFRVFSFRRAEVLGSTRDDAAGEAFDKTAKMLGLGYPGGIAIDRLAAGGRADAIAFPRAMMRDDNFDFSFSGLKTAVRTYLQREHPGGVADASLPDICASLQEAIADVLVRKTLRAADRYGLRDIVIAGGVSANSRLRSLFAEQARRAGRRVLIPAIEFCTDNAAMIGLIGRQKLLGGSADDLQFTVHSRPLRAERRKPGSFRDIPAFAAKEADSASSDGGS